MLNLGLNVVNSVGGLDLKSDDLIGERVDEDLHAGTETNVEVIR